MESEMTADYLEVALQFLAGNELNEFNEITPGSEQDSSFISLNSYPPELVHAAKVAELASNPNSGAPWRTTILAGIRYAKEGRANPAAIQEDIEVWKELAARHGWPSAPSDIISNEENELNEERRAA
jgi:hypothetical protein